MSQIWRFLTRIFGRVLTFAVTIQTFAWFMGVDEDVRQWLGEHRIWVAGGIIFYGLWDYMLYGGKEAAYYEELKRRMPRKPK